MPLPTRPIHRLAAAAALMVAAAPLQAQSPSARLVAEAERFEETDPPRALSLARRALAVLAAPADTPLRLRALETRCWSASGAAPDSLPAYAQEGIAAASRLGGSV